VAASCSFFSSCKPFDPTSRLEEKASSRLGSSLGIIWINDDIDSGDTDGNDIPGQPDNPYTDAGNADYHTYGDATNIYGEMGFVHGTRDLVDYFPIYLDIKQVLNALPPSETVIYKLKQADGAVNFVYTNLTRATAFDYQRNLRVDGFGRYLGQPAQAATKYHITRRGIDIFRGETGSSAFLDAIQNHDGGVILIDGRKTTTKPLVLSIEKVDGTVIAEVKLELNISPVEYMYRRINLRSGPDAVGGVEGQPKDKDTSLDSQPAECKDFPDEPGDPKWIFFLHGYNVSGQEARGNASEMFKRLYWSHNKARYVAVSWFGDPYHDGYTGVPDYQMAVRNSLITAPRLAEIFSSTDYAGKKTVIAHSLGNMVVSRAIQLLPAGKKIDQYCMVDAAVAMEAYDADATQDITHLAIPIWVASNNLSQVVYDQRLWASEWYTLFTNLSDDKRASLTWRGQFTDITKNTSMHNFFSSTEDVLGAHAGTPTEITINNAFGIIFNGFGILGRYAWALQEKAKGNRFTIPLITIQGSRYWGWSFNRKDPILATDPLYWNWYASYDSSGADIGYRVIKTANDISTVSDDVLRRNPLFDPGWGKIGGENQLSPPDTNPENFSGPSWILDLYSTSVGNSSLGSATAADTTKRFQLLSEAIPALTLPAGANETIIFGKKNYNMPDVFADKVNWPGDKIGDIPVWKHGYIREMAYLYIYQVYDKFVSISNQ